MLKYKLLFLSLLASYYTFSQVGINTKTPQGTFHVDANKNNPENGIPNISQSADDFIIKSNGNVGIGTIDPTHKLHLKAENDPLKIEGLNTGNLTTDKILTIDNDGVVKSGSLQSASIPQPTILTLSTDISNFLNNANKGTSHVLNNLVITKNTIPGLTIDLPTSTVNFPPGTYQINFVYEAEHNATGCSLSSYFVDFPSPDTERRRIHSTASHGIGALSNHGGTITFVTKLPINKSWVVRLGRGQSGNCDNNAGNSGGMTLYKNTTQVLIFRIGD